MRIQMGGEVGRVLKELAVRNHSQNILHKKHLFSRKKWKKTYTIQVLFVFNQ